MDRSGIVRRFFPFVQWLPELRDWSVLRADLVAGITVAMVVLPQSMANARLADLPPVYGLYAAFLPTAVAALFGSSRHLSTGPVALASLITAATLQPIASPGTEAYATYAILLAFMVGVFRFGMGLLRLGVLVNLLSRPVVIGFTNAAALIIATSQLPNLLGVSVVRGAYHYQTMWRVMVAASSGVDWETLGMSFLAGGLLIFLRRRSPGLPHVLIAAIGTTFVSWLIGYGGDVVGDIPEGLPAFSVPRFDLVVMSKLLPGAVVITLIGLMEAMSIAKAIAAKTRQRIDIDQELIGQGLANLVGSFFQSYAVSGSFARSAVNFTSGARTGFASVVASACVMAALLWLTPLLYYLPQATLAMIIITAVSNLIRFKPIATAWRVNRGDGVVAIATFACTLVLAPDLHMGILIGVLLSLLLYLYRTMRPRVAYLSRHPDGTLRDAEAHGLALDPKIAILRFDGRLYFGDSSYFEDKVLEMVSRFPELKYLVVDSSGINLIDATGEQTLREVVERLRSIGIDVYFTRVKKQFREVLERTGCLDYIGRDHFFPWNQHALEFLWMKLGPGYRERSPLNAFIPEKGIRRD